MHPLPRFAAMLLACAVSAAAFAQLRTIPDDAKRGEIRHLMGMVVEIDGVSQRLAPGAQIRDAANRIIVPASVPAGTLVRFLVNSEGSVRQVWILTPQEAAKR
jgi:hypothetical protein